LILALARGLKHPRAGALIAHLGEDSLCLAAQGSEQNAAPGLGRRNTAVLAYQVDRLKRARAAVGTEDRSQSLPFAKGRRLVRMPRRSRSWARAPTEPSSR